MIGRLNGELVSCHASELIVDVNGVGYELLSPMSTIYNLPPVGSTVLLYIHFSVSENAQQLFGFLTLQDRSLFRKLIKVNGVGPKMAIGIMSIESSEVAGCILGENVSALVKVPGVGKRTAERLIVEMRDKLGDWSSGTSEVKVAKTLNKGKNVESELIAEAESALVNLGYKPADASKAIMTVYSEDILRSEELIRLALKSMMPT